jgi:hypothetical protein
MNPTILDKEKHRDLRVITTRGAAYGEDVHFVPVVADELPSLILEYPVILMEDKQGGQFGMYALLGFDPGENLYLDGEDWGARYIPAHLRRQPFLVGVAGGDGSGTAQEAQGTVISIDMDSRRISETEGERLFNEDGSQTDFLGSVTNLLSVMMGSFEATKMFVNTIKEHDLIEPARMDITFANGEGKRYEGLSTVSDKKLSALPDEAVISLHKKGYLQACYLLLASLGQVPGLIERKNALLGE